MIKYRRFAALVSSIAGFARSGIAAFGGSGIGSFAASGIWYRGLRPLWYRLTSFASGSKYRRFAALVAST